jgi:hypothetical protein
MLRLLTQTTSLGIGLVEIAQENDIAADLATSQ